MARKLRIVVSGFFGVLTLLLVVLWVRSYRWADELWVPLPMDRDIGITSVDACVSIAIIRRSLKPSYPLGWSSTPDQQLKQRPHIRNPVPPSSIGFRIVFERAYSLVYLNDSVLILLFIGCTWLPWASSRFSLGSCFIATALIATGLGLAVWVGP